MSCFLWEDDIPFSDVKIKMEPLSDFDTVDGSFPVSFGDYLFHSPVKSELKWMENESKTLENTSFDSGYTSSQDIISSNGLSIDPDFVKDNSNPGKSSSKNTTLNRSFSKIEHGGRFSGLNFQQWSPLKVESPKKRYGKTFSLENDFLFEADMSSDSNDTFPFKTEPVKPAKSKRKYNKSGKPRKPYVRKQTANSKKPEANVKPSKKLNDARSKFTAALMDADKVSIVRHKKHVEHAEIIKITKELTARAAQILKAHDPNVRKVRRVIFQENQRLQGDRFTWSVGDSVNKSFKHISVKKGVKRKRGVTASQVRRQALMNGSESD